MQWSSPIEWLSIGISILTFIGFVLVEWKELKKWTVVRVIKLIFEIIILSSLIGVAVFVIWPRFDKALGIGLTTGWSLRFLATILREVKQKRELERLQMQIWQEATMKRSEARKKLSQTTVTDEEIERLL